MTETQKNKLTISYRILLFAAILVITLIACLGAVKLSRHVWIRSSVTAGETVVASSPLENGIEVLQEYHPKHSSLQSIGLKLMEANPDAGTQGLYLTLIDENYNIIASASTLVSMMPEGEYYYFVLNATLNTDVTYYLQLQASGPEEIPAPRLAGYSTAEVESSENGYYTYYGELVGDYELQTDYRYETVMRKRELVMLLAMILAIAFGNGLLLNSLLRKEWLNRKMTLSSEKASAVLVMIKRHATALNVLLIAGFGLMYLSLIFNDNIWTDEAYTVDLLRNCRTISEVWAFTAGDVHPPLYYMILLPFSNLFGIQLQMLKILSIIPMLLTMVLGATYIRKNFGKRTAFFFILFLGTLPITMEYAIQVRMYSWALLFVTICGLAAYDAFMTRRIRSFVVMGLAGTACAYTHYFAFVAALWIYGFLFLAILLSRREQKCKRNGKGWQLLKWISMVLGSILLFLPWLPHMIRQVTGVGGGYWIAPVTKKVVMSYFSWFFETGLPYAPVMLQILCVIAIGIAVFLFVKSGKHYSKKDAVDVRECGGSISRPQVVGVVLGFGVLLCTVATGIILSRLMRPIFIIRYGIPCLGLFSLFLAHMLGRLKDRLYIILAVFCVLIGATEYRETHYTEYDSTLVPEMEAFFAEHLGEEDLVAYNYKMFDFIYQYYFDADQLIYLEDIDWNADLDDVWFLCTGYQPELTQETIDTYGLNVTYMGKYSIEHNQFTIYQIRKQ